MHDFPEVKRTAHALRACSSLSSSKRTFQRGIFPVITRVSWAGVRSNTLFARRRAEIAALWAAIRLEKLPIWMLHWVFLIEDFSVIILLRLDEIEIGLDFGNVGKFEIFKLTLLQTK